MSLATSLSPLKKKQQQKQDQQESESDTPKTISPPSTITANTQETSLLLTMSKLNSIELPSSQNHHHQHKHQQHFLFAHMKSFNSTTENEQHQQQQNVDTNEDDEFFLAISSSGLRTGSCPEFFWYPSCVSSGVEFSSTTGAGTPSSTAAPFNTDQIVPFSRKSTISGVDAATTAALTAAHQLITKRSRACKSESDLYQSTSCKSYENITHNNYVQMVNSMINGAISEVADPEYVEYVRRHLQGLFENFAPVLMKSKSNEEMAMASPSRDKIAELINLSIPKSVSLDFRLLEENGRDEDGMDFSKFGLGIDDGTRGNLDQANLIRNLNDEFDDDLMQCEDEKTEVGSRVSCYENADGASSGETASRRSVLMLMLNNEDDENGVLVKPPDNDETIVRNLLNDLVETIGELESQTDEDEYEADRLIDFETGELKSSTRINFDESNISTSSSAAAAAEVAAYPQTTNISNYLVESPLPLSSTNKEEEEDYDDQDDVHSNSHFNNLAHEPSIGSESTASTVIAVSAVHINRSSSSNNNNNINVELINNESKFAFVIKA